MLRVLHIADLHIGVENYGRFNPESGLHSRLHDFLRCFDEAIAAAITQQVDLVVIAGDMFKNRDPQPRHQREFAARIRQLHDANIPVLMIIGNHDTAPSRDAAHSVAVYEGLRFAGVDVARRPQTFRYTTAHGPLAVVAIPWIIREILMVNFTELRTAALSEQEAVILQIIEQYVAREVATLMAEDPLRPIMVCYHGTVSGAVTGFERQLTLGREIQLPPTTLIPEGVDYVALGHVHKHQAVRTDPPMIYPGSIERIDFGEINETKGYVMVEFAGKKANWTFHPLPARRFVHIQVDARKSGDPMELVHAQIERTDVKEAVVRVSVTIAPEQRQLMNLVLIRQRLEQQQANHVARVDFEVVQPDAANEVVVRRMGDMPTPSEALAQYLQKSKRGATELTTLLELGQQLMAEPE
jgi:exonuclease SbcD